MSRETLDAPCDCGSGKPAGGCCKAHEECYCGSDKEAGDCCYKEFNK